MQSFFDFSQEIIRLNKEKRFSDALNFFKENKTQFSKEQISNNEYLVSSMINSLRKTDNIESAFKFLDIYGIVIAKNTNEKVLTAYGWLLYSEFKNENEQNVDMHLETEVFDEDDNIDTLGNTQYNKSEIVRLIENFIPLILRFNNDYTYSVLSKLFAIVVKTEKKRPDTSWKFILDFCNHFSPDYFNTECKTIKVTRNGQIREMELASDKENWYAYKSKALMKLGRYQECFDISKTALDTFKRFHYSNEIWFARRIAISKKNLGNSMEAIAELHQVLRRKKEWFIQKELAELYFEVNDLENAFKYAIQAINNSGDIEYKVDLLFLLGEILKIKQENHIAFQHFSLSELIRIEKTWKIPQKLKDALKGFNETSISSGKSSQLISDLKKYWNSFKQSDTVNQNQTNDHRQLILGSINRILHNNEKGIDGFITYDDNKSIYFRVNVNDPSIPKITVGMSVEFELLPARKDKKEMAVHVRERK